MYNENEQRLKMINLKIKSYEQMVDIHVETAEKMNNMNEPLEAKVYIEQAKTLLMVIDDLKFML